MQRLYTGKWLYTAEDQGKVITNFAMLCKDERIEWIAPQAEMSEKQKKEAHSADEKIDLGNQYVVPGFIDCHVHLIGSEFHDSGMETCRAFAAASCKGAANAYALLKSGVVVCRDLGSWKGLVLGVRDAIDRKELPGPKVIACGKAISAVGGHGYELSYEAVGQNQIRQAVCQVIKDGGDVVKLMVSGGVNSPGTEPGPCELTEHEMISAIQTAHSFGRKVAAHAHGETAIRLAVEAGIDSIEHGVFMSEAIMDLMKVKGTFFVPTLCAPYYAVNEGLRREPDNPDHHKSQEILERHREVLRHCSEKGIKIAMGTDAGCPFNPYEKAPHEMVLMTEAGLSPEAAIRAGTRGGAALLGLQDWGSLEPGKRACFLGLNANPLEHIASVDDEKTVYLDGKLVN